MLRCNWFCLHVSSEMDKLLSRLNIYKTRYIPFIFHQLLWHMSWWQQDKQSSPGIHLAMSFSSVWRLCDITRDVGYAIPLVYSQSTQSPPIWTRPFIPPKHPDPNWILSTWRNSTSSKHISTTWIPDLISLVTTQSSWTRDEGWNVEWLVNKKFCLLARLPHHYQRYIIYSRARLYSIWHHLSRDAILRSPNQKLHIRPYPHDYLSPLAEL